MDSKKNICTPLSQVQIPLLEPERESWARKTKEAIAKIRHREACQRYLAAHPEKERLYRQRPEVRARQKIYMRRWREKNRERCNKWSRQYYQKKGNVRMRELARALKIEVLLEYGGICKCCGDDELLFLTIDHIDHGRGNPKILHNLNGWNFYARLKREGFPKNGLQVLCMDCNAAKMWYGICPHQTMKTPIDLYFEIRGVS